MRADISQFRSVSLYAYLLFFIACFLGVVKLRGRILPVISTYAIKYVRPAVIVILTAGALWYGYKSIHWKLMVDSSVMHYVNFLMDHGRQPYTDITDNNMPGAYYTDSWAMHIFGGSDLGWRIYDYFLLATLTATLAFIARPYDWLAGFFAGGLFIAVHGVEGPQYSVEREQVLTVLLVLGYAAMFAAVRRRRPMLMLIFGVVSGLSASIKPTFLPLPFVLAALLIFVLRRRSIRVLPYVTWLLIGMASVMALNVMFLIQHHAIHSFIFILTTVTPVYAGIARASLWLLITLSLPPYIPVLVLLAIVAGAMNWRERPTWTWEQWALAVGAVFGWLSFVVQGKPFWHHRYTFLVLLFLFVGIELLAALRRPKWPQNVAVAAFAFTLFWIVPHEMRSVLHITRQMPAGQSQFAVNLESDLRRLGPAELQNKVQCFDLVYGCLNSLYHLGILENTSYTGDLLFFAGSQGPAVEYYKNKYWDLERRDPCTVIVLSNEWFQRRNSFDKIKLWPEFEQFLHQNFTQVVERRSVGEGNQPSNPDGYRIYIRNGSPLLQKANALQGFRGM